VLRAVVIVVCTCLLAACGGEDSDTAYRDETLTQVNNLIDAATEIQELTRAAAERVALFLNDDWQSDMREQLSVLHDVSDAIGNLSPPDEFEDAHAALSRATECYSDGATEYEQALDAQSALGNAAGAIWASCGDLMQDATLELQRVD
jgi:hypothetical protein